MHVNLNACDLLEEDLLNLAEGILANEYVNEYTFDLTGNPRIFDASSFIN